MEESTKTLLVFIKLIKDRNSIFSADAWQDLANLDEQLAQLETEKDFDIANIILDWCEQHPDIQNTLSETCQNLSRADIVESEEQLKEIYNPRQEGKMVNNKFLVREAIQSAIQQPPPTTNNQK
ncbi:hypothetical protein PCC7424_4134 [Gloeothece citriformis PCC 7424]|uniref:Uncharacterized protein n=1 Tax=Gloeothece citriformis (strain PCC 7424) TaxID=65393 RepID=B7KLD3_GLOC7|nr:hypothetical protein [Gloeothece citriformis]ACK72505.1 hypothetical protein PCC7424_4134 [Gloeothece citriformis PCC 7424]